MNVLKQKLFYLLVSLLEHRINSNIPAQSICLSWGTFITVTGQQQTRFTNIFSVSAVHLQNAEPS